MNVPNKHIRRTIVNMVHNSSAAHLGSSLSAVELLAAIFRSVDIDKIRKSDHTRDRIILSKGHGTAALYAMMFHFNLLSREELNTYFKNGTILAGHASHFVNYVEHSTGALGHGAPVAVGVAVGLRAKGLPSRIFVVTGDGELQEGSNWEAFMLAGHLKLGNICVLVDRNNLQQVGKVDKTCSIDPLRDKMENFGFNTFEVDGHNEDEILDIIMSTRNSAKPVFIICKTVKGKGISFMEDNNLWHYRSPQGADYENAMGELRD